MLKIFSKNTNNLSDQELIEKYQRSSDLDYLGILYNRYLELQFGLCLKYLKDRHHAEDAVMSIFEELIGKVKKHKIDNFRSWLYVLSKNHCLMKLRKDNKRLEVENNETSDVYFDKLLHPNGEKLPEEDYVRLESCMEKLPENQRMCIKYHYFDKKSYKEIAELLGHKNNKVRSFIQNGRRNLRICIEKNIEKDA